MGQKCLKNDVARFFIYFFGIHLVMHWIRIQSQLSVNYIVARRTRFLNIVVSVYSIQFVLYHGYQQYWKEYTRSRILVQ